MADRTEQLDEQPVHWREEPYDGAPTVYLHGVPNSGDVWKPFIERSGGLAPDLPGFGRSGKRADLPYSLAFYDNWFERFLDWRELDEIKLVVHDWGGLGLMWAQRHPDRVDRLVIIDSVPLLPGYKPAPYAKLLRAPGIGEFLVGLMSTRFLKTLLRDANVEPLGEDFFAPISEQLDQGTQRAILKLYRSVKPGQLESAGRALFEIKAPALVLWGERDRYVAPGFADFYGDELGGPATVRRIENAGHWPWLDRAEVVDEVVGFLRS